MTVVRVLRGLFMAVNPVSHAFLTLRHTQHLRAAWCAGGDVVPRIS